MGEGEISRMIPDWNMAGLLPPIRPGKPGENTDRSPYVTNLSEVVKRFAFTTERIDILKGLLCYRQELYRLNITDGFQWVDGSFTECIEVLDSRPPRDVDVVTFFNLPAGSNQKTIFEANSRLFNGKTKLDFRVDGFYCPLGQPLNDVEVRKITYWYSMWSHRRSGIWKGFVQVALSPQDDQAAHEALIAILQGKGQ